MENGVEDIYLFDPAILTKIDWKSKKSSFKNEISPFCIGNNLTLNPLSLLDYDRGYMQLLSQLTVIGDVTREKFTERFECMKSCKNTYYVSVVKDTEKGEVIGSASLIVEQKFIHNTGCRGRIEDVVINTDYRGKQLGKLLVEAMTLLGKSLGCYKMSLECKDENKPFYQNFGYEPDGQFFMVQKYKENDL